MLCSVLSIVDKSGKSAPFWVSCGSNFLSIVDKRSVVSAYTYNDIAEETGYDKQTLKNIKSVSENVPAGVRNSGLSFTHHREVASLPPSGSTRSTRMEQTGRAIKSR